MTGIGASHCTRPALLPWVFEQRAVGIPARSERGVFSVVGTAGTAAVERAEMPEHLSQQGVGEMRAD